MADFLYISEKVESFFRRRQVSQDERIFCLAWKEKSAVVYGIAAMYMMGSFHLGSLALDTIDALRHASIGRSWILSLSAMLTLVSWFLMHSNIKRLFVYFYLAVAVLTLISISERISLFHDYHFSGGRLPIAAHMGYTLMAAACIGMIPTIGLLPPIFLITVSFVILHTAWSPYPDSWPALRLSFTFLITGLMFHFILVQKSSREARREFQARTLLNTLEKARLEQDLLLARRIQDSLSSYNNENFSPFAVGILQQRFSQVGGDWAAIRKDSQGALYVLVADAAGKGIQAALVLHAVQSLWAESLGRPDFDPEQWLRRVNLSLCQLGAKKPHMLTIGIAKFSYIGCSYFSAGHLPLFLVKRHASTGEDEVRILLAPGTPVGLINDLTVGHAKIESAGEFFAFLGSDGFFRTGSHQRRKAIIQLKNRLASGETLLGPEDRDDDDQTLIWVTSQPHFKPA